MKPSQRRQSFTGQSFPTGGGDARLLAAAADVFAERGYDGAGVAEIARRAGPTTGAIYSRSPAHLERARKEVLPRLT